ncbi:flagellar hook-length control protein FliK [Shimia marina]|uniref:Flagellar hook-length control protein FliK n=1 Tax=Shimia marina TaxID=321267 RepID=A0A0P1EMX4_9RHOB|nr:flagellar hook-length control protein FliK [Shimia marina]CUH51374.1 Flagellar hook-length control protein FliK [Shimia marina]SFD50722.1 hook-length control protein FliK [Shimia marina]
MINLPFATTQPSPAEVAAPKKHVSPRREDSDFSDIYDDVDREDTRPSGDVNDARSTDDTPSEDTADSGDSTTPREGRPDGETTENDAPQDADFAATEVAEASTEDTEPALRSEERRAPTGTSENAAMLRLDGQTGRQAATSASTEGDTRQSEPQIVTKTDKPVVQDIDTGPQPAPKGDVEKLQRVAEAEEGLDPMQVTVRNKTAQTATTATQALAAAAPVQTGAERRGLIQPVAEVPAAETVEVKPDTSAPTGPTATQQMQAKAIVEQVQAGVQPIQLKTAEVSTLQTVDSALAAAIEESSARSILSPQEAVSQARLANSAPNPAYVVRQIADAVKMSDKSLIELAMDPPELGKVRMSLSESSGVMTVSIAAENQATTELMRRHIDMLRKDFMEMGYENVSFSFEQNSSDSSQQNAQSGGSLGNGAGMAQADGAPLIDPDMIASQQAAATTLPGGGIDIRL